MRRLFLFLAVSILWITPLRAQNDGETFEQYKQRKQKEMADYKQQKKTEFEDFRKKANEEYAAFLKQRWEELQAFKGIEPPVEPKPPVPTPVEPDRKPTTDPIPYKKVVPLSPTPTIPQPLLPDIPPVTLPTSPSVQVDYYGLSQNVRVHPDMKIHLENLSEDEIARAWILFSDERFDITIHELLNMKAELQLNDWGYVQLVRQFCNRFFGKTIDEAAILQAYILSQSGVDMRLMRTNQHLYVAIPFTEAIYHRNYILVDDIPYYLFDQTDEKRFDVMNKSFAGGKVPSLRMNNTPSLPDKPTETRVLTSERYPEIRVSMKENQNLIDFYNDYPLTSKWNYYSLASLSGETKEMLYPMLKSKIGNLSESAAANMLINFVQTAFEYATDQEQFGYERPLFGDETFYYPFSDCEDRSILYSILVRDLLGLDVVLLHFPGHLATAVRFSSDVNGDYLLIDNVKYVVCDPTYIGASIGMAMPQYKEEGTEIEVVTIPYR